MGATNYFGNPNCTDAQSIGELASGNDYPNWLATINNAIDLRYAYVSCCYPGATTYCSQFNGTWPSPDTLVPTTSSNNGFPVMFTTEALYYAQSGYFVTIVMIQWSNVFACKSRKMTIIYSGPNKHMFGGIILETILFILLLYVPGLNDVFGGRQLPFFMMGIPGLGFSMLLLCW
jgi:sodium/potassium-transporting ATPase subunit alpha